MGGSGKYKLAGLLYSNAQISYLSPAGVPMPDLTEEYYETWLVSPTSFAYGSHDSNWRWPLAPPQNSKHCDGLQQACHCDLITVFWTSVSVRRDAVFEENENERSHVSSPERVKCTVDFMYVSGDFPENNLSW